MLAIILLTFITGVSGVDGGSLQFTNLEIRGEKCDADGKLYFTAENKYLKPLFLKDLVIEGWHEQEKNEEKIKFYPTVGMYDREEIYTESTKTKKANFVSGRGLLNESGRYFFNVTYPGCKNLPCTEHFDLIDCPGYKYSCEVQRQEVKITGCTEKDDIFQIFFEGFNAQQHQKVDVENEVLLYVETNGRQELRKTHLEGKEILPQAGKKDAHIYRFPLAENETVVSAGISSLQCDTGFGPGSQVFWCAQSQLAHANETRKEPARVNREVSEVSVRPRDVKKEEKEVKQEKRDEENKEQSEQETVAPSAPIKGTTQKESFFTPVMVIVLAGVWVVLVIIAIAVFAVAYKKN